MAKKRAFSGIQPTGVVHIGNYLGALRHWIRLQESHECLYSIVDLHALTVPGNAQGLRERVLATAAMCLAAGVDPEESILFVQSEVSGHAELAWILNCFTYFGELRRMTQFKDKGAGSEESCTAGLFDYPVLMTADILLYRTDAVPVGDDQRQHLELARDIARRFNNVHGDIFKVPEALIASEGSRIMGLDDPSKKMSKSASSEYNYIALSDSDDVIRAKMKSAVTDSGKEIVYDEMRKPAISNLMTILSLTTGKSVSEVQTAYAGAGYGVFKTDVAKALIEHFGPIRSRYLDWLSRPDDLNQILSRGAERARRAGEPAMEQVREALGLSSKLKIGRNG